MSSYAVWATNYHLKPEDIKLPDLNYLSNVLSVSELARVVGQMLSVAIDADDYRFYLLPDYKSDELNIDYINDARKFIPFAIDDFGNVFSFVGDSDKAVVYYHDFQMQVDIPLSLELTLKLFIEQAKFAHLKMDSSGIEQ